MNHYAILARNHWGDQLPNRYAALTDPKAFFGELGTPVNGRNRTTWPPGLGGPPTKWGEEFFWSKGPGGLARGPGVEKPQSYSCWRKKESLVAKTMPPNPREG